MTLGDQLSRYADSAKQDVVVLYLIHKDLRELIALLKTSKADTSRRQAGF